MEFPKNRGGWSGIGRTVARGIAGDDVWLRKRRFGSEARNKGGPLEVRAETPVATEGYYSLGKVAGVLHVVGSLDARVFIDRGAVPGELGFEDFSANALSYYGKGRGGVATTALLGTLPDFNGKPAQTYALREYTTVNGKKFELVYETYWTSPYISIAHFAPIALSRSAAATLSGSAPRTFRALALGFMQYRDGQYKHTYVVDDGTTQFYGNTITNTNQLALNFVAYTTAPTQRVAAATYMRVEYDQTGLPVTVDNEATPGIVFQFSDDRGENWAVASGSSIIQEFVDTVASLPDTISNANLFNIAIGWFTWSVAPVAANISIAYMVVPYAVVDGTQPYGYRIRGKVKLGVVNHAARTVLETVELYDGEIEEAFYSANGPIIPVDGGAVFVEKLVGSSDYRDNATRTVFTADGVAMTFGLMMPQPAWKTGTPMSLSPTRLGCPMYDGEYSLYESKDRGATWTKRGVLSADAVAPVKVAGANYLIDFGTLVQLKDAGGAASATPGAPWISNSRRDPPIL